MARHFLSLSFALFALCIGSRVFGDELLFEVPRAWKGECAIVFDRGGGLPFAGANGTCWHDGILGQLRVDGGLQTLNGDFVAGSYILFGAFTLPRKNSR